MLTLLTQKELKSYRLTEDVPIWSPRGAFRALVGSTHDDIYEWGKSLIPHELDVKVAVGEDEALVLTLEITPEWESGDLHPPRPGEWSPPSGKCVVGIDGVEVMEVRIATESVFDSISFRFKKGAIRSQWNAVAFDLIHPLESRIVDSLDWWTSSELSEV